MANPLFNNQLMSQLNQFKSNPMLFLNQRNVNIPQQFSNNPEGAVHYLLDNGIMSQEQFNQLSQLKNTLGF